LSATDGANLPDELYVALLGFKIRALVSSDLYNGFVVEDFPRTKNQAALLLQVFFVKGVINSLSNTLRD
jgi:adenylate kinase family enzyme